VIAFELLEHAHQTVGAERGVHLNVKNLAIEVVDHIERPVSLATSSASPMKSMDQTASGCLGTYSGTRSPFGGRRLAALLRLSFITL